MKYHPLEMSATALSVSLEFALLTGWVPGPQPRTLRIQLVAKLDRKWIWAIKGGISVFTYRPCAPGIRIILVLYMVFYTRTHFLLRSVWG